MEIKSNFVIDIANESAPFVVYAVQGENSSRTICLSLFANGFSVPVENHVCSLVFKKPDGTNGWYDTLPDGEIAYTVSENNISIKIAPQVLTVPGNVKAAIRIESQDATNRATTFPFIISVSEDPAIDALKSENYYKVQNWDQVNTKFLEIEYLLNQYNNVSISDDIISKMSVWSSKNTVDKLCKSFEEIGSVVTCQPVEGYPLHAVSKIEPVQEGEGEPSPDTWEVHTTMAGNSQTTIAVTEDMEGCTFRVQDTLSGKPPIVYDPGYMQVGTVCGNYTEFTIPTDSGWADANIFLTAYDESATDAEFVVEKFVPGNLRPITGHTAVKLWHGGKNLFDFKGDVAMVSYYTVNGESRQKWGYQIPLPPGRYTFCTEFLEAASAVTGGLFVYPYIVNSENRIVGSLTKIAELYTYNEKVDADLPEGCNLILVGSSATQNNKADAQQVFSKCLNVQLVAGDQKAAYEPYRGEEFSAQLGQVVYGGSLDWQTGVLTITHGNIPAYSGEAVPEGWISSTGQLSEGAQVVYPLETPVTVSLTPRQLSALSGINCLYSTAGDTHVTGRADPVAIIDSLLNRIAALEAAMINT